MPETLDTFETLQFFRGLSDEYSIDKTSIIVPRKDRRPRNSSPHFHEVADKWFLDKFGIPYRSQGVFVIARVLSASAYATSPDHVVRVIPLSTYRFCWSKKISDLLFGAQKLANAPAEKIKDFLESACYQEDDLSAAHSSGNEVKSRPRFVGQFSWIFNKDPALRVKRPMPQLV